MDQHVAFKCFLCCHPVPQDTYLYLFVCVCAGCRPQGTAEYLSEGVRAAPLKHARPEKSGDSQTMVDSHGSSSAWNAQGPEAASSGHLSVGLSLLHLSRPCPLSEHDTMALTLLVSLSLHLIVSLSLHLCLFFVSVCVFCSLSLSLYLSISLSLSLFLSLAF